MRHIKTETLSAHLDQETTEEERLSIPAHLRQCPACAEQLANLTRAKQAMSSLEQIALTADEQRTLRTIVLDRSRIKASRAPRPRRALAAFWAVASGVAVVAGMIVFANVGTRNNKEISGIGGTDTAAILQFESPEQVRTMVEGWAEVGQGIKQYRVSDVGAHQEEAIKALAPNTSSDPAPRGTQDPEVVQVPLDADYPQGSDQRCLRSVLQLQRHPTMPLVVRQATFKTAPAWLLVYVWTPNLNDDAPLDRLQYWLVNPSDCAALNYSSSRPR